MGLPTQNTIFLQSPENHPRRLLWKYIHPALFGDCGDNSKPGHHQIVVHLIPDYQPSISVSIHLVNMSLPSVPRIKQTPSPNMVTDAYIHNTVMASNLFFFTEATGGSSLFLMGDNNMHG